LYIFKVELADIYSNNKRILILMKSILIIIIKYNFIDYEK